MSNDRELLELAAKAAGYTFEWGATPLILAVPEDKERPWGYWHPLAEDDDAFRLAVKLDISLRQQFAMVVAEYPCVDAEFNERNTLCEGVLDDHCASSRRAIVRAAAAMAKTTA